MSKPARKRPSRALASVHETARGLRALGFIDERKMREFDALCLPPVKPLGEAEIRALRKRLNVSQAVLATLLNTSKSAVQKWEIGEKAPSGPSLRLLDLLKRKGIEAVL